MNKSYPSKRNKSEGTTETVEKVKRRTEYGTRGEKEESLKNRRGEQEKRERQKEREERRKKK